VAGQKELDMRETFALREALDDANLVINGRDSIGELPSIHCQAPTYCVTSILKLKAWS
jgi:hypothetical protein